MQTKGHNVGGIPRWVNRVVPQRVILCVSGPFTGITALNKEKIETPQHPAHCAMPGPIAYGGKIVRTEGFHEALLGP